MKESSRDGLRSAYRKAYEALNSEQKRAVDTIEGPVMVIAGPGTGKTQILALRIANILLSTDTAPESVLALTFTEAGAVNMRERLRTFLGAEAYRLPIFTFHAFAEHLIRTYPNAYERIVGGRLATDLERTSLIETILETGTFKRVRPPGNPTYHLENIIRQIAELKREAVTPDDLARIIATQAAVLEGIEQFHTKGAHKGKVRGEYKDAEEQVERNRELLTIYRQYEAVLRAEHWYDYNDMILETLAALEGNEDMRLQVEEQYQYVLADEHQDVNASQNRLLELITSYHDQPNIFVVGDEKQAIFRFQGASLSNFLFFGDVFGKTTTIALTQNYRSGQTILDAAHSLIAVDEGPLAQLRVPLTANRTGSGEVFHATYPHQAIEDDAVVQIVQNTIASGVAPAEMAVIARSNREVEALADRLSRAGIPVAATADTDVLSHPITDTITELISLVTKPGDPAALASLLHRGFVGIDRKDLVRVLAAQSYDAPLAAVVSDEASLRSISVEQTEPFLRLMRAVEKARGEDGVLPPHRVLAELLRSTGFIDHVAVHEPISGSRLVRRLYDEVETMVRSDRAATLEAVLDTLEQHRRYGVALTVPMVPTSTSAVSVMTAHKAKGLEFEVVVVPHISDGVWGGQRRSAFFKVPLGKTAGSEVIDPDDDERRLFYVALTRAKHAVYLSNAIQNTDGKARNPSRFLEELDSKFLTVQEDGELSTDFDPLAAVAPPRAVSLESTLFSDLLRQRGISATSLNNYLESPWTFVYRNLLRMPEVQSETLLFGSVVHSVLESFTKAVAAEGKKMSATELKREIERSLGRLPLSKSEYTRLHKRALEALVPYTEHVAQNMGATMKEELKVSVKLPTGLAEFPEVLLTGKLDRLDIDEDGQAIRVVDYKTGKPKTRGQIEGTTKDSNGNYKRQLVFYALLLELYDDQRYGTRQGTISFVEPDGNGQVREESFVVTNEDVATLKEEIVSLVKAVTSGSFLREPCDSEVSDYCHLVELLQG